jgi:hypothetical protein
MLIRVLAAMTVPMLLISSAEAQLRPSRLEQQARDERSGVVPMPGARPGVPARVPQPNRSLGGVPSQAPRKIDLIPFTRQGPTRRTMGQPNPTLHNDFGQPLVQPISPGELVGGPIAPEPPRVIVLPPGSGFIVTRDPFQRPFLVTDGTFLNVGRGFFDSSTVNISGGFDDGNFSLRFNVGGGALVPIAGYMSPRGYSVRHRSSFPMSYSCAGGVCGYSDTLVHGVMSGYDPTMTSQPAAAPQPMDSEEAEPVSERERGDLLLRAGRAKDAIAAFQSHLRAQPNDADAMRGLGLAMIVASQFKDGVSMVSLAYKTDPTLASDPISVEAFGSRGELRRILERVSLYANRSRIPAAWLTLAALMQTEGRTELAIKMIDRGREAGLEPEIAAQMAAALKY